MIQPDDIRRKARNLYPRFLVAWLEGGEFFPRTIPANRRLSNDPATAIADVHRLREGSKEKLGYGYSVEWREVDSRRHGRNRLPQRILFETQDDFLRYIDKRREFKTFADAVNTIRSRYPELLPWIRSHSRNLIDVAADVDGLLLVVNYLREHPRPGLFARELPLSLDTKFVERHKRILFDWLDLLLPPQAVRADERHFERRYGFRYAEPHWLVRFLDPGIQQVCECPWPECSIPLSALAELPIAPAQVLIVENKVNLLTLPKLPQTLALGGLGNAVTELRLVSWLHNTAIYYWGDIDPDGLAILSRLRSTFPQMASLMMDAATLLRWRESLAEEVDSRQIDIPPGLTEPEMEAFVRCVDEQLRIEQERIPQSFVNSVLAETFGRNSLPES